MLRVGDSVAVKSSGLTGDVIGRYMPMDTTEALPAYDEGGVLYVIDTDAAVLAFAYPDDLELLCGVECRGMTETERGEWARRPVPA